MDQLVINEGGQPTEVYFSYISCRLNFMFMSRVGCVKLSWCCLWCENKRAFS